MLDMDFDNYGFTGEYVYGDDAYISDEYMDECWKRYKNSSDYWVSNKGRVWSSISNSFIEGTPNCRTGHIDISTKSNGKRVHRYLHRMIAETFIPNPKNYPMVRHIDDDPSNNIVDNLAWGTQKDNMRDSINNGHFKYLTNADRENAMKKRRTPIKAINTSTGEEIFFNSQQEASRLINIDQSSINMVLKGKRKRIKNYIFEYMKKGDISEK